MNESVICLPRIFRRTAAMTALAAACVLPGTALAQTMTWGPTISVNQACVKCNSYHGDMKVHASGNAVAIWVQNDGIPDIAVARYDAKLGVWRGFKTLYEGMTRSEFRGAVSPRLVMDKDGNAMAFWTEDASSSVQFAKYQASTASWSRPATLHIGTNFNVPQMAASSDAEGNVVLHWIENISRVMVKRYNTATRTWSASLQISDNATFSGMAVDTLGNAMIMWQGARDHCIYYSRFDRSKGQWSTPRSVGYAGESSGVSITLDNKGNGMAFWRAGPTSNFNGPGLLHAFYYHAATDRWSNGFAIHSASTYIDSSKMVFDSAGHAMLTYSQADIPSEKAVILARRFNPDTQQWSAPQNLSGTPRRTFVSDMTIDGMGNIVTLILDARIVPDSPLNEQIMRKGSVRYDAASRRWGPVSMRANETPESFLSAAGVDALGNVITLYIQDSGYRWNDSIIFGVRAHRMTLLPTE